MKKPQVPAETILLHYQEHSNQLLPAAKVMKAFKIKTRITLNNKLEQLKQADEMLVTGCFSEMVPRQGPVWHGGTMYVEPETADESTIELLQEMIQFKLHQVARLEQALHRIHNKPKLKVLLLPNQARAIKQMTDVYREERKAIEA
jgi:hypothetical protein